MIDATLSTRGVLFFPGRVRCPFAGLGQRGDHDSNRLAVDDPNTVATLDRERREIVFSNSARYAERAVLGDVLFLVDGVTATGKRTPLSLHLKVHKKGHSFFCDLHRHLRTSEPIVDAEIEPFTVVLRDGAREKRVLTPESAQATIRKLPFMMRVIKTIMLTRDNLIGVEQDPQKPGFAVADLSMGFGLFGFNHMIVRAQLMSLTPLQKPALGRGLVETLQQGSWEFRLTALANTWLGPVIKRDLFLFGLEDLPVLRKVRERGLLPGETMSFRFERGRGAVSHDAQTMELPNATDVARSYLECHLLGGLLAEYAEDRLGVAT